MAKPLAGRCGKCGCAMPQPTIEQVERQFIGWKGTHRSREWVMGHCYEWDVHEQRWRLVMVCCDQHRDPSDAGDRRNQYEMWS